MIDIATGVAFLVSSLYSPVQAQAAAANAVQLTSNDNQANTTIQIASVTQASDFATSADVMTYVRTQYKNEPILVDIARCESSFRQYGTDGNILRGKVNHDDVGVMQINERYHADEALKLGYDIYTVPGNIAFGKYLYEKSGAQPWSSSSKCWSTPADTDAIAQK